MWNTITKHCGAAPIVRNPRTRQAIITTAGAASSSLLKRWYHENIVEHYENPRNVGSLDKNDEQVGTVRAADIILYPNQALFVS